jgi:hypothetical protein
MFIGPFDGPLRVKVPLNAEGWFGIALTILLTTKHSDFVGGDAPQQRPSGWRNAVAILGLIGFTIATFWRTLHFYFLSDDFILVKLANTFHLAVRPLFTTGGGDGFFRPVGYISLAMTSMWAGTNPVAWHTTALALHIINSVLVFTLVIQLGRSRMAASFAATLFAIHGTRPEAAVWIAGRFDLVATFFVLAGLLFFMSSYREASTMGYLYETGSLVCMVLAILTKESAYIFPLILVRLLGRRYGKTAPPSNL